MRETCVRKGVSAASGRREGTHDTSAEGRRVGDLAALEHAELTRKSLRSSFAFSSVLRDDVECPDALSVQSRVLGETLAHEERHASLDKVPHRPRVVLQIARREALVRAVEEGVVLLGEEDVGNFLPLLACRVDTGGVVRAGVEEEDGLGRGGAEEGEVGVEGEADRLGVVIGVVDRRAADVGKDGFVVGLKTRGQLGEMRGRGRWTHPRWDC